MHRQLAFFFESYISFNSETSKYFSPILILPPGEAGAESYINNLVPLLKVRNLILFNNINFHLSKFKFKNLVKKINHQKLALFYISFIKKIQLVGPYN